jgi:serine/threonine-protein kinase
VNAPFELAPHTICGPFEILEPIGHGGAGAVYKARGPEGELVAIKTLQVLGSVAEQWFERFKREITILFKLDHPNVVGFRMAGRMEGPTSSTRLWLAMEYIVGHTLRDRIHDSPGRIPAEKIARWGRQIADGVAAAHEIDVIHRDLKPENVMLTRDELIKVLDFNVAKALGDRQPSTAHGRRVGTLAYMSPEQVEGDRVDARSDVHALGMILWELATGAHVFNPRNEPVNVVELNFRIVGMKPEPLSAAVKGFPEELSQIVARCLEKDARERFQTMLEVRDALYRAGMRIREERRVLSLQGLSGEYSLPSISEKHDDTETLPDMANAPPTEPAPAPVHLAAPAPSPMPSPITMATAISPPAPVVSPLPSTQGGWRPGQPRTQQVSREEALRLAAAEMGMTALPDTDPLPAPQAQVPLPPARPMEKQRTSRVLAATAASVLGLLVGFSSSRVVRALVHNEDPEAPTPAASAPAPVASEPASEDPAPEPEPLATPEPPPSSAPSGAPAPSTGVAARAPAAPPSKPPSSTAAPGKTPIKPVFGAPDF